MPKSVVLSAVLSVDLHKNHQTSIKQRSRLAGSSFQTSSLNNLVSRCWLTLCRCGLSPQVSPAVWFFIVMFNMSPLEPTDCQHWKKTCTETLSSQGLVLHSFFSPWPCKMSVYVMVLQISACLAVIVWLLYVSAGKGGPGFSGKSLSQHSLLVKETWLLQDRQRRVINLSFIPFCYL